ncbi:hypothetical protein Q0812_13440 [Brevundimonas sp. 2R-24]|uniref:Uncharacterized protein n=1 Tax=Peiella sedimenti TaxID=3061083 RepID=A0ABT8SQW4_9CAUL|nr:hypothetical protein [Caulobacteraceae bacterium XZ-24]
MPERAQLIEMLGSAGIGGLIVGFWQYMSARLKSKPDADTAQAALIEGAAALQMALNKTAEGLVSDLRHQLEEQAKRIEALEADKEQCRGENRQMAQRVDSLEALLRRNGITVPEATARGALLVVEGGQATVMKPKSGDAK